MNNKIHTFLFLAATLLLASSCKRGDTPVPPPHEEQAIVLGVGGYGVSVKSPGVANDCKQFKDDNLALYAVSYKKDASPEWPATSADYLIRNTSATVVTEEPAEGQENRIGEIIYYTDKPTIFPETRVALYSIYPTTPDSGLELIEQASKAPAANVTLKTEVGKQYDVMTAVLPSLSRDSIANKHRATLTFEHTLAMLKIKVYAEPAVVGNRKLTAVTVNANSKATLADISSQTYTDHSTPLEIGLYNDATGAVIPNDVEAAAALIVQGQVMIFPEPSKVNSVTITVDGQDYTISIPDTYQLKAGQTNTLTIKLTPLGVQLGTMSIGKWETTADLSGNTEVMQYKTNFKVKLYQNLSATPVPYSGEGTYKASVKINGVYWLEASDKTRKVPCTLAPDGTLSFDNVVPTFMLNNDPVYLSELVIFKDDVEVLNQKISSTTQQLEIEKGDDKGNLKVAGSNTDASFNVTYGGFGAGTADLPYLVDTPAQLAKIASFVSATATIGVHFIQTADIDLGPYLKRNGSGATVTPTETPIGDAGGWTPIGNATTKFYGTFDGNGKTIKNLNINRSSTHQGLFGYAGKPSDGNSELKNITISGYVKGTQYVGLIAGAIEGTANITNCVVDVTLDATSTNSGGIVGYLKGATTLTRCTTNGSVKGAGSVGGMIGFVTGGDYTITKSTNNATVTSTATAASGCLGQIDNSPTTINNVLNNGTVTSTNTKVGGIIGAVTGSQPITVENSGNTAQLKTTSTASSSYVGGIIGYPYTGISGDRVAKCYNTGDIISSGGYVGGLVGNIRTNPFTLVDCYNSGKVTGKATVGGLLSNTTAKTTIEYSYNAGTVTGTTPDLIATGSTAAKVTNVYYHSSLTGTAALSGVTSLDMTSPEALTNLNGSRSPQTWSADMPTPVNNGMPILLWQTEIK